MSISTEFLLKEKFYTPSNYKSSSKSDIEVT